MTEALESVGFEVIRAENATRRDMNQQLQLFLSRLQAGDEALFYFAGHGVEIAGRNYLLPTDVPGASPGQEEFVRAESVPVDRILNAIRNKGTKISILVLDACRNNPFPSEGTRSLGGSRGLARMPAAEGTFIMYSAGVGQTALDRLSDDDPNPNSVFTRNLIPLIKKPGLSLTRTAREVRRGVQDLASRVSHDQRPAYYDEVTGEFFFAGKGEAKTANTNNSATVDRDALFWTSVKDSSNAAAFESYLDSFPKGQFAALARLKLAELQKGATAASGNGDTDLSGSSDTGTQSSAQTWPETVNLSASVWPVGKWPEGIAFDGRFLWVAESGQRQVARLSLADGRIVNRTRVGRLPVQMTATSDGRVFSLVHTDKVVRALSVNGAARQLARLNDYPADMIGDDNTLWVLTNPGGSSAQARLVRLDQRSGKATSSGLLGENASDIALELGKIWVVHGTGSSGRMTVIDAQSLNIDGQLDIAAFVDSIESNLHGIFLSGGKWNNSGIVLKYDKNNGDRAPIRRDLPGEFVRTLATFGDKVIAIGTAGTIWVLSATDLSIERRISLDWGEFEPQDVHATADTLYITTHRGVGENGSVVVVNSWLGGPARMASPQPTMPSGSSSAWTINSFTSDEESEGRGASHSASVTVAGTPGDPSFSLSCYPTSRKIELAMMGSEKFEAIARAAVDAARGRTGNQDSYIDIAFGGQTFAVKATYLALNYELNLDDSHDANGPVIDNLLKAHSANLLMPGGAISIPLSNSRNSICQVLSQCGISQIYCQSKGQ